MNIATVVTPAGTTGTGATGTAAASVGTATGSVGLGDLFTMQMFQAFQSLPQTDELTGAPEDFSQEDMDALQELMALLAQMAASGQNMSEELVPKLEEKADAIQQLLQKVQGQFPQIAEDWKQMLTKLAEGEPAAAEMDKLAELLEALKSQKGAQETTKKSPVLVRSDAGSHVNHLQHEANKSIQPLRFNQGLSAYKVEAGISSQIVQSAPQDAGLLNQNSKDEGGMPFANAQAPVTASGQLQTNQPFQQSVVQTYNVNANQLPQQVTQIFVKQMKLSQVDGLHEAKLVLNPQSLGKVDVTITSHNGVITAHFSAETQAGKDMLDNQLSQLRVALTQQGLQVDRLEVNQQQETAFSFQQQRDQTRQQQNQNSKKDQQEEQEFALDALVDNNESTESLWNRLQKSARGIDDIV